MAAGACDVGRCSRARRRRRRRRLLSTLCCPFPIRRATSGWLVGGCRAHPFCCQVVWLKCEMVVDGRWVEPTCTYTQPFNTHTHTHTHTSQHSIAPTNSSRDAECYWHPRLSNGRRPRAGWIKVRANPNTAVATACVRVGILSAENPDQPSNGASGPQNPKTAHKSADARRRTAR
jgi:hypothetical protein